MGLIISGLGMLLALPGVQGSGKAGSGASSTTVVLLLLLLLLLLLTSLALAWRRLSRDSNGYYHPARLGAALWGRTCRLLRASPAGRWLGAQAEPDPESQEEQPNAGEGSWDGTEEPWAAEGPRPQRTQEVAEDTNQDRDHDTDEDDQEQEALGLGMQGPAGSGGSSEALLSGLQAFAGSAAWDDSGAAEGNQALHVTAL